MKNKNLLIGGGIALAILLYLRSRRTSTEQDVRLGEGGSESEDSGLGGGGGGALAQENGGGAIMQTGSPIIVAPNDNYYRPLPSVQATNTLRPLPIIQPLFSPKPLFSKPAVSTMPSTSPAPRPALRPATNDVSANISQAVSNATNLRNFSTFNGMADGKVNGLDFGGDLD